MDSIGLCSYASRALELSCRGAQLERLRWGNADVPKDFRQFRLAGLTWRRHSGLRIILARADSSNAAAQRTFRKSSAHHDLDSAATSSGVITIPLNYYQILGLRSGASERQILGAYRFLKHRNIHDGFTVTAVLSRQEFLEDVKARLLGSLRHEDAVFSRKKSEPSSVIPIPFPWVPGALALLHEVGEHSVVEKIGSAVLKEEKLSLYHRDVILAMALSKCSRAKEAFERSSVSEGFEELVQAHALLKKAKDRLHDTKLIAEIEASLDEMAPACALEHLRLSCSPEKKSLRPSALAALRELIERGLSGEPSCSIRSWENFISEAFVHLTTDEICSLLPWLPVFLVRKRKNEEAEYQKKILSIDCLYTVIVAHLALGFWKRQPLMIEKASMFVDNLASSEKVDVRVDQAVCAALLGMPDRASLLLGEVSDSSTYTFGDAPYADELSGVYAFTEDWVKDQVLKPFPDTRECNSSLADYFADPDVKRYLAQNGGRSVIRPERSNRTSPVSGPKAPNSSEANASIENGQRTRPSCIVVYNKDEPNSRKASQVHRFSKLLVAGILTISASALALGFSQWRGVQLPWDNSYKCEQCSMMDGNNLQQVLNKMLHRLGALFPMGFQQQVPNKQHLSDSTRRSMKLEDAEVLIRHWQAVKAAALGPQYAEHCLSDILADPMLTQWRSLVDDAKAGSCYWRFVLLNLTVVRADIIQDELGWETAELEAILEEAAELVEFSKPTNPNYYSTYRAKYQLCRSVDRTWRISHGKVEAVT